MSSFCIFLLTKKLAYFEICNFVSPNLLHSMRRILFLLPVSLILFLSSCIDHSGNTSKSETNQANEGPVISGNEQVVREGGGQSVFYGLYTPDEISGMLKNANIHYESSFFLEPERAGSFTTTSKMAMNLGVYGADFSLNKMFNNVEGTLKYMTVISQLSEKLGIPPELIAVSKDRMDQNQNNIDSLHYIVNQTYNKITEYLSENNRENLVSLIFMGAWIEGLYLATNYIYVDSKENPAVIERIIEQKYSLNYLMAFMKNYYDDFQVAYYYRLMGVLKKHFEKLSIQYKQGQVDIDTMNQTIKTEWNRFEYTQNEMDAVQNIIQTIREIITES